MSIEPNEDRLGELLLRWDEPRRRAATSPPESCAPIARSFSRSWPDGSKPSGRWTRSSHPRRPNADRHPSAASPRARAQSQSCRLPSMLRRFTAPSGTMRPAGWEKSSPLIKRSWTVLVALKRIRPDKLHDTARRRFLREAALTARLQHPGIVPIYGLGQDDGGPFYTMPFIQGRDPAGGDRGLSMAMNPSAAIPAGEA